MLCTYTGSDSRTYPSYLDTSTSRMLEVAPGGTYNVVVTPGQPTGLPLPPGDGRWVVTTLARGGVLEAPAKDTPPVFAAIPAAQVTSQAGDRPAEKE